MTGLSTTQVETLPAQLGPNSLPERAPVSPRRRAVRPAPVPVIHQIVRGALVAAVGKGYP